MRIFLDIGAHKGKILEIALRQRYNFDKLYSFDPVKENCDFIKETYIDDRLVINAFGLLDKTCEQLIYCPGSQGASIFKKKPQKERKKYPNNELCRFVKASDWFKNNLSVNDYIIVTMNCEGQEIDILNDLLFSGEYDKIDHIMIDFDVRKIEGMKHLEKEINEKLNKLWISNYILNYEIRKGGPKHHQRIEYWLKKFVDGVY